MIPGGTQNNTKLLNRSKIAHEVALGPGRTGQDVKTVLCCWEDGPSWSLQQKVPGETPGQPLGFWSWGHKGSEAWYTPVEKETLEACAGVWVASGVLQE